MGHERCPAAHHARSRTIRATRGVRGALRALPTLGPVDDARDSAAVSSSAGRIIALLEEADAPVGLQDGPLHVAELGDLVEARLCCEFLVGDPLAAQVSIDDVAV